MAHRPERGAGVETIRLSRPSRAGPDGVRATRTISTDSTVSTARYAQATATAQPGTPLPGHQRTTRNGTRPRLEKNLRTSMSVTVTVRVTPSRRR
ncbi:hypothetical protein STENM327S_04603 [Streptomyces tendae]